MSIHEHLPPQARRELNEVGWTKGLELAKIARRDRQNFDCATWLHKAREMPKEQFKHEVEKELTGRDTEPAEIIYFKLYKSQIPVIEQAIETLMLENGQIPRLLFGNDLLLQTSQRERIWRMKTPEFSCSRRYGSSSSSPARRGGRFCTTSSRRRHDAGPSETRTPEGRPQVVCTTPKRSATSRWLEMPILRRDVQTPGPPQRISRPFR